MDLFGRIVRFPILVIGDNVLPVRKDIDNIMQPDSQAIVESNGSRVKLVNRRLSILYIGTNE